MVYITFYRIAPMIRSPQIWCFSLRMLFHALRPLKSREIAVRLTYSDIFIQHKK